MLALLMKSEGQEKVLIDSMSANLSSKGILDIARVTGSSCPPDSLPLMNNVFPGTDQTCLCRNNSSGRFSFRELKKNYCQVNSYHYKCQQVTLPEKKLEIYRGSRLCYKPTQFSYDSYQFSSSKTGCPPGTRVCGKDYKGYLCLQTTYPCPVNFLKIVQGNVQNFTGAVPGSKIISLDQNNHLLFSNQNQEGEIVSETNWAFEQMCANPEQKTIKSTEGLTVFKDQEYWLEQCDNVDGLTVDNRWRLMDSYNWLYLLGENASSFKQMESSNLLDVSKLNVPYNVYHRGYLHFNKDCRWDKNSPTYQNIRNLSNHNQSHPVSLKGMLIGAIVLFSVAILVSLCFFCVSTNVEGDSSPFICCGCLWVLLLVAACLIGAVFYYSRETVSIHQESASFSEKCMDSVTAKQLNNVAENKMQMLYFTLVSFTLAVLGLLMLCVAGCCLRSDSQGKKGQTSNNKYEMTPHHGGYEHQGNKGNNVLIDDYQSNDAPFDQGGGYQGNFYDNPAFQNNQQFGGGPFDQGPQFNTGPQYNPGPPFGQNPQYNQGPGFNQGPPFGQGGF